MVQYLMRFLSQVRVWPCSRRAGNTTCNSSNSSDNSVTAVSLSTQATNIYKLIAAFAQSCSDFDEQFNQVQYYPIKQQDKEIKLKTVSSFERNEGEI